MIVILHNFYGSKYLINTKNINSVELVPADPDKYAEEITKNGDPLTRMFINWFGGSSTSVLISTEVAEEFVNIFEDAVELF